MAGQPFSWRLLPIAGLAVMLAAGPPAAPAQASPAGADAAQPSDEVLAERERIDRLLESWRDESASAQARVAALEQAVAALRTLIEQHPGDLRQPMWQVDLAELLLTDWLEGARRHAGAFVEFGIPAPEQRAAHEKAVREALRRLEAARQDLTELRDSGRLAGVERMLRQRLIDDYLTVRSAYYLARAAYHASLIEATPDARQLELLDQARALLTPLVESDAVGREAASLLGRVELRRGAWEAAETMLKRAVSQKQRDLADFCAGLGLATLLHRQGDPVRTIGRLEGLRDHPQVAEDPLLRLIVADRMHLTRLEQRKPGEPLAPAWAVYERLLAAPMAEDVREGLRGHLYRRWEAEVDEGALPEGLPALVQLAVGRVSRERAEPEARDAVKRDEKVPPRARAEFERAVAFSKAAAESADSPALRAEARLNQALAQYWLHPRSRPNLLEAAEQLVRLAAELPGQKASRQAMRTALTLLRPIANRRPGPYGTAAEVLLRHYGDTPFAHDERLAIVRRLLRPAERYEQALAVLDDLPADHPAAPEARRERLMLMRDLLTAGDPANPGAIRQRLLAEAREAVAGAGADDESQKAAATARLILADLALREEDPNEALEQLDGFERDYPGLPELVSRARQRRVLALASAGRLESAAAEAVRMLEADPEQAAAEAGNLLEQLDERANTLQAEGESARAKRLASAAARLAGELVAWAERRDLSEDQHRAIRLIQARSLRLAGRAGKAMEVLEPLRGAGEDDPAVLHEAAETLFARGDPQSLTEAVTLYDRLIRGLGEERGERWWNAWLRRLQIMDRLDASTGDIPRRIEQLRLLDPDLGGPAYRAGFERLAEKHRG
ncbi:MAG: hypothetical protein ACLFVN_00825 [Phycisphaeraceae bacterium]